MKFPIICALILLVSCKPEQEVTQFTVTISPQAGETVLSETPEDNPILISYSVAEDEESMDLTFDVIEKPQHGILKDCKFLSKLEWQCVYVPNKDFNGEDKIAFKTRDGDFSSKQKSYVRIQVLAVPDAPEAGDDQEFTVVEKTTVTFEVRPGNDPDTPQDKLSYTIKEDPEHGSFIDCFLPENPNFCTYKPHDNLFVEDKEDKRDKFEYIIKDADSENNHANNTAFVYFIVQKEWVPVSGTSTINIEDKTSDALIVFALDISSSMEPFIDHMKTSVLDFIDKIADKRFNATIAFITSDQTVDEAWMVNEQDPISPHPLFLGRDDTSMTIFSNIPKQAAVNIYEIDAHDADADWNGAITIPEIEATKNDITQFLDTFLVDSTGLEGQAKVDYLKEFDDERLLCSTLRFLYSDYAKDKEFVGVFSLSNEEDAAKILDTNSNQYDPNTPWLRKAFNDCKKDRIVERIPASSCFAEPVSCAWDEVGCIGNWTYDYNYNAYPNQTNTSFQITYTTQIPNTTQRTIYEVEAYELLNLYANAGGDQLDLCEDDNKRNHIYLTGSRDRNLNFVSTTNRTGPDGNNRTIQCTQADSKYYRTGTYKAQQFHWVDDCRDGKVDVGPDNPTGYGCLPQIRVQNGYATPQTFPRELGRCDGTKVYVTGQVEVSCAETLEDQYSCKRYQEYTIANERKENGNCSADNNNLARWNGTCVENPVPYCSEDHTTDITGHSLGDKVTREISQDETCVNANMRRDSNGNTINFATINNGAPFNCRPLTPRISNVDGDTVPTGQTTTSDPRTESHQSYRTTCTQVEDYYRGRGRAVTNCGRTDGSLGAPVPRDNGIATDSNNNAEQNCETYLRANLTGNNLTNFTSCNSELATWTGTKTVTTDENCAIRTATTHNWYRVEGVADEEQTLAKSLAHRFKSGYTKSVYLAAIHDYDTNQLAFSQASTEQPLPSNTCNSYNATPTEFFPLINGGQFKEVVNLLNAPVEGISNSKGSVYSICSPIAYPADQLDYLVGEAQLNFTVPEYQLLDRLTVSAVKVYYANGSTRDLTTGEFSYSEGNVTFATAGLVKNLTRVEIKYDAYAK